METRMLVPDVDETTVTDLDLDATARPAASMMQHCAPSAIVCP
jgi:hypothetical protein